MARVMMRPFDGEGRARQWHARLAASSMGRKPLEAPYFALLLLLPPLLSCGKKIGKPECDAMLDRYIDMVVAADIASKNVPPAQVAAVREMKKAVKKAEASYVHVQARCESEVTRKEYDCAMAAKNADEWEACIE
jgi:hypothetical protein